MTAVSGRNQPFENLGPEDTRMKELQSHGWKVRNAHDASRNRKLSSATEPVTQKNNCLRLERNRATLPSMLRELNLLCNGSYILSRNGMIITDNVSPLIKNREARIISMQEVTRPKHTKFKNDISLWTQKSDLPIPGNNSEYRSQTIRHYVLIFNDIYEDHLFNPGISLSSDLPSSNISSGPAPWPSG